ncbi:hypothetical protein Pla100_27730 [Neorhodopirellula pilleata]|uniref:Uncharacterized protein n=1 Tax=Neorhodopirellula pilleata TaxID=2714738 RepID=A0A5C6AA32_9BACT|nr:hypothetical protein Pla100_27730 [Neorhodopirellula pilleata]
MRLGNGSQPSRLPGLRYRCDPAYFLSELASRFYPRVAAWPFERVECGWGLGRSQAACRVSAIAATQPTFFRNSLLATRFFPRVAAWPFERVECGWGLDRSQAACRVSAIAATQPTFFRNSLLASRNSLLPSLLPSLWTGYRGGGDRIWVSWLSFPSPAGIKFVHLSVQPLIPENPGLDEVRNRLTWTVSVFPSEGLRFGLRAYPKRGLTLWRRVDFGCMFGIAGEGQTPFRMGS